MYTLSSKLKLVSIIFMVVGLIGLAYGFIAAPSSIEEVKEMVASHDDGHGGPISEAHTPEMGDGEDADGLEVVPSEHEAETERTDESEHVTAEGAHENEHYEHLLHQLQNKPWAAI